MIAAAGAAEQHVQAVGIERSVHCQQIRQEYVTWITSDEWRVTGVVQPIAHMRHCLISRHTTIGKMRHFLAVSIHDGRDTGAHTVTICASIRIVAFGAMYIFHAPFLNHVGTSAGG